MGPEGTGVQPGDAEIMTFTLESASKSERINLISQCMQISIYEDISLASIRADINIIDAENMLHNLPIVGQETVRIKFRTPTWTIIDLTMYVHSVTNVNVDPRSKTQTYTLNCISREHVHDGSLSIQKSYQTSTEKIVEDLLRTHIQTEKRIDVEPTKGSVNINIPGHSPFRAIEYLRKKAVSSKYESNSFVFYESRTGYHFRTIEGLFAEGIKNSNIKKYTLNPSINLNQDLPVIVKMYNIINYSQPQASATLSEVQGGALSSTVYSYDFLTKKLDRKTFELGQHIDKFISPNKVNSVTSGYLSRYNSANDKQTNERYAMSYYVGKDSSRPDDFFETGIAPRNAFAHMLNRAGVIVYVYGNSSLQVGEIIEIAVPSPEDRAKASSTIEKVSGKYLIAQLRHIITPGTRIEHRTSMHLIRTGYKA